MRPPENNTALQLNITRSQELDELRTVLRFLRVTMQVRGIPMIDTMLPTHGELS